MRVLFLGSPEFAVPSLKALIASPRYEVLAVVTQPDRKAGRGQRLTPPPVKVVASEAKIPVFQFSRIRKNPEAMDLLMRLRPEILVVVAFGQILPRDFFEFPKYGTLNVHASLLPKYRGASPVAYAILNGESETGITIMKIDEGMDTGDILSRKAVPLGENVSAGELEALLAEEGAELLVETIRGYVQGEIRPTPQDSGQASYAPRLDKEDGRICWSETAVKIHNLVRAMNPWPVAFTSFRDQKLKIWETALAEEPLELEMNAAEGGVVTGLRNGILVRCGSRSYLSLLRLQLPSRQKVTATEFVNGTQLKVGERLI